MPPRCVALNQEQAFILIVPMLTSLAHYWLGVLIVHNRIMAAMKCRGFKGKFYIIDDYQMKGLDYIVAGSGLIFIAALLIIR